jgi:glycosyltransferase involved in cell wall biosynthesis
MNYNLSPLISIIIPIYNGEKYLKVCLDSILAQTYTHFELILVDDGSTDTSSQICDAYAESDSRVITYHISNGGVSHARNYGINVAKGGWITFIDCDDWITPDYLKDFASQNLEPSTLYIIQADKVENGKIKPWPYLYKEGICKLKAGNERIIDKLLVYGTPWGKFFNSAVVKENKILFDEQISNHEDTLFYFEYIRRIKNIRILSSRYYYRIESTGSLSKNMAKYQDFLYSSSRITDELNCLIQSNGLKNGNFRRTRHLIQYIKTKAIRSSFFRNESDVEKEDVLKIVNRKDILKYYRPTSFRAIVFMMVLLLFDPLRKQILLFFRYKLNK